MFVYNPDGFEPQRHLPPKLHPYSDCARVLVHLIETARVFNKLHTTEFVPRKAQYLRRLVHKEMYLPIRDALLGAGVLEMDRHYVIGKHSCGFRIGERFKDCAFRRYRLSDRAAIRRLQRVRAEHCPFLNDPIHKGLHEWLTRLEVDFDDAWAFLRGLELPADVLRSRHLSLAMLRDREFFFKPDLHGRVHTNVTNLWSGFRQFLRCDGEGLVNLDIGNSQPLFFGLVVLNWIRSEKREQDYTSNSFVPPPSPFPFHYDAESIGTSESGWSLKDLPDDLRRYLQITEQAQFYEHMMAALGIQINKPNRDAFKEDFFKKVFYCKPKFYTKERKAFLTEFPTVLEHITRLKQDDPRNAPLALQRVESEFVIGTVCKRILEDSPETPLWTIHDSIMTSASRGEFVRKVMQEEFAKLGVHPRLLIEVLAEEPAVAKQMHPQRSGVILSEIGTGLLDGDPVTLPLQSGTDRHQEVFPLVSAS